jgi:hypothetical protein
VRYYYPPKDSAARGCDSANCIHPRTLQQRGETAITLLSIPDTIAEIIGEAAVKVQGRTAHAQTGNLLFSSR